MPAPKDLQAHAKEFLDVWCNEKDLEKGMAYLHPDFTMQHNDNPPISAAAYRARWEQVRQAAKDIKIELLDSIQEGNKIWSYSRISGLPGGGVRDSVDMTEWDDEGRLLRAKDVQRDVVQKDVNTAGEAHK